MPKVCKKSVRIGKELFEGEIFLLPKGLFLFMFPNWMRDLEAGLAEHGFVWGYTPKRGSYKDAGYATAETKKSLEEKIEAIVKAATSMGAKESLVIFYKFDFKIRQSSENKTLKESDFSSGGGYGRSFKTGLYVEWQIVRQFKYSETNIIYKHQKHDNRIEKPHHRDNTRIVDHTPELEAFFVAFDAGLEAMIEKLLVINNVDALDVLVESMSPAQLMSPDAKAAPWGANHV